ncbi:hypothetical protein [Corynebacterium sp. 13CS0277]|uniref:hypothetical protein n=1 Tax=Corynebacterium sp. 13CS0277 TaxID=2071994 RepID=UPI00351606B0
MTLAPDEGTRPLHHHWLLKVPVVVSVCALASLPWVIAHDSNGTPPAAAPTTVKTPQGSNAPNPQAVRLSDENLSQFVNNPTGSQVSYTRLSDGFHTGTATERFARPALSLIKLYIADYVLEEGDPEDAEEAIEMIEVSDDRAAEDLYARYPDAVAATAERYGLLSTRASDMWGYSVTSTYDVVSYITQKLQQDPTSPVLGAMRAAQPVAADGYAQDFGTVILPGVKGSKWGWSNDLSLHSSVSFGEDFVVAAAVTGTADDLTNLVRTQLGRYFNLPTTLPPAPRTTRALPTGRPQSSTAQATSSSTSTSAAGSPPPEPTTQEPSAATRPRATSVATLRPQTDEPHRVTVTPTRRTGVVVGPQVPPASR